MKQNKSHAGHLSTVFVRILELVLVLPKDSSELLTKLMDAADFNSNQQGQAMIAMHFFQFYMVSPYMFLMHDKTHVKRFFCKLIFDVQLMLNSGYASGNRQANHCLVWLWSFFACFVTLCHRAMTFCKVLQGSCLDEDIQQLLSISI